MLSTCGNCTRLLWEKNKLKIYIFLQIKSGRILYFVGGGGGAFLIKQSFHSRVLDMRFLQPTRRTRLVVYLSSYIQVALVE